MLPLQESRKRAKWTQSKQMEENNNKNKSRMNRKKKEKNQGNKAGLKQNGPLPKKHRLPHLTQYEIRYFEYTHC